jgi:hypothetical protein
LGVRSAALGCLLVVQLGQPPQPASAAERGAAEEIVDQFRRGEEAWRASCPQPTEDGSCVELRSTRFRSRLFVIERDPALVAEARRHFLAVATLWRRLGGHEIPGATESVHPRRAPPVHTDYREIFRADADVDRPASTAPARPDVSGAAQAATGAAFYLAEAEWEAFIRLVPPIDPFRSQYPPDADLILEKPSRTMTRQTQRRFKAFIVRKLDQLVRTRQTYLTIVAMRRAPFDVAARARIGQLYQGFDDDIPVEQLEEKAVAAFEKCFDQGAKDGRYDEWFRLCERGLTALRPTAFPEVEELVPEASYAPGGIVPAPVIPHLARD